MTMIYMLYALFLPLSAMSLQSETTRAFRFHTAIEPVSIDPVALSEPSGGFLFNNLFRGLYKLDSNLQPVPDLAKRCFRTFENQLKWKCELNRDAKFSDGSSILANDYLRNWRRLIDSKHPSKNAELLLSIKNAQEVLNGTLEPSELMANAKDDYTLEIELAYNDSDFLYKLSSPLLTAISGEIPKLKSDYSKLKSTGPYSIDEWVGQTRILLKPNTFYGVNAKSRPPVEVLVVEEDSTALQLYDLGKLDFLRRVTVKDYSQRKRNKDFIFTPFLRFDFMGFGEKLQAQPHLRKALALSLNYPELTKAYQTPGEIGCTSLPKKWAKPWPCLHFNLTKAKEALKKVDAKILSEPLHLHYSVGGGDDVQRGMEWMQAQWQKHLGIKIILHPKETPTFLALLKTQPPDIYRRGFNLDRPKCLAAIEKFRAGNADNFSKINSPRLMDLIEKLRSSPTHKEELGLCGQSLDELLREPYIIPLGEIYIGMLARPTFVGWRITPLNQLDLTDLKETQTLKRKSR